jgi:hypothetical protein
MDRTYDAYGRREPGYFDSNQSVPQYTSSYSAEPRDSPSFRGTESSAARKRSSPINDKMASGPDRDELAGHAVSPELIAAITEKVKREGMPFLFRPLPIDLSTGCEPCANSPH